MKLLEEYILKYGHVIDNKILKVDSFLNHQIDPKLMDEMGKEFASYFKEHNITKIVTIESSGIAPAVFAGLYLNVPVVFAKKALPSTIDTCYSTKVISFTKNKTYDLVIAKEMIDPNDNILFIDDFLANGEAFKAIEKLIAMANANIKGVGIVIDKVFQNGHKYIIDGGYDLCSLAKIAKVDLNLVEFEN